jgi:hypothetical protein
MAGSDKLQVWSQKSLTALQCQEAERTSSDERTFLGQYSAYRRHPKDESNISQDTEESVKCETSSSSTQNIQEWLSEHRLYVKRMEAKRLADDIESKRIKRLYFETMNSIHMEVDSPSSSPATDPKESTKSDSNDVFVRSEASVPSMLSPAIQEDKKLEYTSSSPTIKGEELIKDESVDFGEQHTTFVVIQSPPNLNDEAKTIEAIDELALIERIPHHHDRKLLNISTTSSAHRHKLCLQRWQGAADNATQSQKASQVSTDMQSNEPRQPRQSSLQSKLHNYHDIVIIECESAGELELIGRFRRKGRVRCRKKVSHREPSRAGNSVKVIKIATKMSRMCQKKSIEHRRYIKHRKRTSSIGFCLPEASKNKGEDIGNSLVLSNKSQIFFFFLTHYKSFTFTLFFTSANIEISRLT